MTHPALTLFFALSLLGCGDSGPSDGRVNDLTMSVDHTAARDLTSPPGDLAQAPDLAIPGDLATAADLASPSDGGIESRCVAAGGQVAIQLCCLATNDFPNLCLIGPCGCAPMNSHMIKVCRCGANKGWNGTTCRPMS